MWAAEGGCGRAGPRDAAGRLLVITTQLALHLLSVGCLGLVKMGHGGLLASISRKRA